MKVRVIEGKKGRGVAEGVVKYVVPGEETLKKVMGEVVEKFSEAKL